MKETIKKWYNNESFTLWYHNTITVGNCVKKGIITSDDYKEITGNDYTTA